MLDHFVKQISPLFALQCFGSGSESLLFSMGIRIRKVFTQKGYARVAIRIQQNDADPTGTRYAATVASSSHIIYNLTIYTPRQRVFSDLYVSVYSLTCS